MPFIELAFDYGGMRVRANDERTRVFRARTEHGGLESVSRDPVQEDRARHVLERLGAVDCTCVDSMSAPEGCDAEYVVSVDGDAQAYCAFTARALAQFRSLGWSIDVDPEYPFHLVEQEPAWYGSLSKAGRHPLADPSHIKPPSDDERNWFGLELGIVIDGVTIDSGSHPGGAARAR